MMYSTASFTIGSFRASSMSSLMSMLMTRPSGFTCLRIMAQIAALPPLYAPASTMKSGFVSQMISWMIHISMGVLHGGGHPATCSSTAWPCCRTTSCGIRSPRRPRAPTAGWLDWAEGR